VVVTPANTAQWRGCAGCQAGSQYVHLRLVPCRSRDYRSLALGLVKIRGTVMRAWVCDQCQDAQDAGTRWPTPAEPVRDHIVSAIRRLKNAGYRFFDWEK
jgi:hypothetical protein